MALADLALHSLQNKYMVANSRTSFNKVYNNIMKLTNNSAYYILLLPFPKRQILDSFKLKEFADDNLKCDINDKKFSKPVENTVGKAEIARYEQFLLFPQCFQKNCTPDT